MAAPATPHSQARIDAPRAWPDPGPGSNGHGSGHGRGRTEVPRPRGAQGRFEPPPPMPDPGPPRPPRRSPGPPPTGAGPAPGGGSQQRVVIPPPSELPPMDEPPSTSRPARRPGPEGPPPGPQPGPPPAPAPVRRGQVPPTSKRKHAAKTAKPARKTPSGGPVPSGRRPAARARRDPAADWARLAPVYDTAGPRIRYGVVWFGVAFLGVVASPVSASFVYGAAAAWAARQVVQAWRGASWQADLATALAGVPVLAAAGGSGAAAVALGVAAVVAVIAGANAPAAGLRGSTGHLAAAGVLLAAVIPVAVAGAAMVLVRIESPTAAGMLVLFVSVYEVGDYLVGSAASNPVEGPLAGGAAVIVTGFPMALLFIEPFDVMGAWLLGVIALCCPVGQWIASAVLPRPGAHAPALRRIDTLLFLAPLWIVATGAM